MAVIVNPLVNGSNITTDHVAQTTAAVMSNGLTIFNVFGDIQITSLVSECVTANNATASTLQYAFTSDNTTATTFSGASTTLASKTAGNVVALAAASTLAEVPTLSANAAGVVLNTASRGIRFPSGAIKLTIGVGSTTGTWRHYLRYEPLEYGAYVTAAF
jgi:hypothetical protein